MHKAKSHLSYILNRPQNNQLTLCSSIIDVITSVLSVEGTNRGINELVKDFFRGLDSLFCSNRYSRRSCGNNLN